MNTKDPTIEFLVSTMHRTDFDFLNSIFKHFVLDHLHVLVINQTTKDKTLRSERKNIRVINSFDRGLSKSRNLALENAVGDICFITDDDVEYLPDAIETVAKAYQDYPHAALISFQFLNQNGKLENNYQRKQSIQNNLLHKQHLHSIEVTLRPELLIKNNIRFNTCFGIGALFKSCEEEVLRDDLVRRKVQVVYVNKPIIKHLNLASIADEGSKDYTQAITAVKYRLHKNLIYLWLIRYIWILLKLRVIGLSQVNQIWTYGINAVKNYKRHCEE